MLLNDFFADSQAQTGAPLFAGVRRVNLLKAVKDGLLLMQGNPPPFILHMKQQISILAVRCQPNPAPSRRKLYGIPHQVGQYLNDPVRVRQKRL